MKETEAENQAVLAEELENEPVDKKRVALLNGACGQSDRLLITGQIVDIPVTAAEKIEEWDPILSIPLSQKSTIRAIQDFGISGVRRARLQLEILENRGNLSSNGEGVLFTSDVFTANDNSRFEYSLKASLPPGDYLVRVILRGIDSLRQSISDLAYIGESNSLILKNNIPIGHGRLRVLPPDHAGWIVTSDIDQTFLDTDFGTNKGLMAALTEELKEKRPLPGMPELYRQILYKQFVPLVFLSGSPHFFHRTFSSLFEQLQIDYTGMSLKDLRHMADSFLRKTFRTVVNLDKMLAEGLSEAMERAGKFLSSSYSNLFEQIVYKLTVLLENRLMQPTGVREILIGDNTESDYFVFILYQYLISGKIPGESLENYLYRLRFRNHEPMTRDMARKVAYLTRENLKMHGKVNSVTAVWINLAASFPDKDQMESFTLAALPVGLAPHGVFEKDIVTIQACYGAVGISLAALDRGLIDTDQLAHVWKGMMGDEFRNETINTDTFQNVLSDFKLKNYSSEELLKLVA